MTCDDLWRFSQRTLFLAAAVAASACSEASDAAPDAASSAGTGGAPAAAGAGGAAQPSAGGSASGGTVGGPFGGGANGNASGAAGRDTSQGGGSGSAALPPRLTRYHRTETDRSLHFELDAVEGLSPFASSLDYLGGFVAGLLDKPDGIVFNTDETLARVGSDHVWTFDALDAYAREHAGNDENGPVSIHVLFVDGSYDSGDGGTVLGLAWGHRYIAMFQDAIRAGCTGGLFGAITAEACEIAERNVWAHEIGHVIGLVDNGLTQQTNHRDAEHGRHDVADSCLMYWAYDRPEAFDALLARLNSGQSADVDFCENCRADLNAARQ